MNIAEIALYLGYFALIIEFFRQVNFRANFIVKRKVDGRSRKPWGLIVRFILAFFLGFLLGGVVAGFLEEIVTNRETIAFGTNGANACLLWGMLIVWWNLGRVRFLR